MRKEESYSSSFYTSIHESSLRAASVLLDIFFQSVPLSFSSVLDLGCGDGSWLRLCAEKGLRICGVDGPWVNKSLLQIPETSFHAYDLEKDLVNRESALWDLPHHDLLISLEVAEHLEKRVADAFVTLMCQSSDIALFSAAIPFQPGNRHVNCQWPSYWAEKLRAHRFVMADIIRPKIWGEPSLPWWYKQNIFVVLKGKYLQQLGIHKKDLVTDRSHDVVHPDLYLKAMRNWAH